MIAPLPIHRDGGSDDASRVVVVGGGAAGFFAAITCAETSPGTEVIILERGAEPLAKVRISGGGRCNVTHACFDPRRLVESYPRGRRELLGPFHVFQPSDTVRWFESRGVGIKTEADGRMFPTSDSSATIVDCLRGAAADAGVRLRTRTSVERVTVGVNPRFHVVLDDGSSLDCNRLLIATGGARSPGAARILESLGHVLEPPVPSLFAFHVPVPWLNGLAGITLADAEISAAATAQSERSALLVTHHGLSGPAVLRLSAAGARKFHDERYRFEVTVNWLPGKTVDDIRSLLDERRDALPKRLVVNAPIAPLPARLWERLVVAAGIDRDLRWSSLSRQAAHWLATHLSATALPVTGKSLNKDEFVTAGGVRLRDVDFKTMESRAVPGLHFAGEVLDIDGFTGGFNFQAAWTTGWIAGNALAQSRPKP